MICPYPIELSKGDHLPDEKMFKRFVPCGTCGACRYNYQQDWIFRLRWEYNDPKTFSTAFYTFTIDNEHLKFVNKWNNKTGEVLSCKPTLDVKDMQLFWKRLRRKHERDYPNIYGKNAEPRSKLRYYMVGEYGSLERPHYHAIIFNLHPDYLRKDWPQGNGWINNKMKDEVWHKGMCHFGEVTQKSIAYCAKFHMLPNNRFEDDGRIKEHSNMSKRPYIGNYYEKANGEHHRKNETIHVRTPAGKRRRMPKIYKNKIFSSYQKHYLSDKMKEELHNERLKEIDELKKKGYDKPVEQLRKIHINKEQQVKRHAKRKKGHF